MPSAPGPVVWRTPTASPGSATSLPVLLILMTLVIAPLIALSQVIAYWRTDVVDDQMFAYFGWRIAHGATIYLDVWDNKPPGIYWINALGMLLGRDSYFGVIATCVGALIIAHVSCFVAAASVFSRGAAAITTMLLSFFLTHAYYTGGTNRTETFLVACELTAVAMYFRGWACDRGWKWLLAGTLCGAAFLFKQVGLAAWGCLLLHLVVCAMARELSWPNAIRRAILIILGAGLVVGGAAGVLARQGALEDAVFATFGFNQAYFAAEASQFPYNYVTWSLVKEHMKPVFLLPLLMALAALIHAFLWWLRPQYRPPEIEEPLRAQQPVCPYRVFLFFTWYLVSLYGALLSPHGFRHYLVPTIPPLLLLCGYLVNVLRAENRLVERLQQRASVLVAFILIGYFSYEAVQLQFAEMAKVWTFRLDPWLASSGWYGGSTAGVGAYEPAHWEVVGDAVLKHTTPEQRIQCWGYMPGVYLHARRINAARFTTTEKPGQVGAAADFILRELEDKLRRAPPALITMQHEDYEWLHGRSPRGLPSDAQLGAWLDQQYVRVEEIPKFETVYILKRRDLASGASATQKSRVAATDVEPRAGRPGTRPSTRPGN